MESYYQSFCHLVPAIGSWLGIHLGIEECTCRRIVPRTCQCPVIAFELCWLVCLRSDGTVVEDISPCLTYFSIRSCDVVTCSVTNDEITFFKPDVTVSADPVYHTPQVTILEIAAIVRTCVVRVIGILITLECHILQNTSIASVPECYRTTCTAGTTISSPIVKLVLQGKILSIEVVCFIQLDGCRIADTFHYRMVPYLNAFLALSDKRDVRLCDFRHVVILSVHIRARITIFVYRRLLGIRTA